MKIRKDDNIIVISGKDKGKTGKVVRAFPKKNTVIVQGINMRKKHQRPTKSNQKGQIVERAMPINVSNTMIVEPGMNKGARVGKKLIDGKFVRISRQTGKQI